MARSSITTIRCTASPSCSEHGRFEYSSRREYSEIHRQYADWKCVRHSRPETVLSAANPCRTTVITLRRPESVFRPGERCDFLSWSTGSGYLHGPGFQAFAEDFPEGTIVEVTARLILPATVEGKGDG